MKSNDVGSSGSATLRLTVATPGFRGDPGGVEVHTSELVRGVARRGVEVEVVSARRGIRRRREHAFADCRSAVYPAWRLRSMSVSPRAVLGALRRHFRSDILHVHSYHATTAFAVLGSRRPTVFTPHYHGGEGHSTAAALLHQIYRPLGRRILGRSDAIICVSSAERDLLIRDFPFVADKVEVIPNGVRVDELQRAVPYPIEDPVVLCVGRLEPYKRFHAVIRAFGDVPAPARLVVVGDGSQRDELRSLVRQLGLEGRVDLVGTVGDDELYRWFRTARVLVSMSDHEAFGMVPLEAAAAGSRVVLSDIPAHREIFAAYLSGCGVVVSGDAPSSLAEQITGQLGAGGQHGAAAIPSWTSISDRTVDVYRRLLVPGDTAAMRAGRSNRMRG